eukprot:scaffold79760_cov57-Attheya_sp.AAC.2
MAFMTIHRHRYRARESSPCHGAGCRILQSDAARLSGLREVVSQYIEANYCEESETAAMNGPKFSRWMHRTDWPTHEPTLMQI